MDINIMATNVISSHPSNRIPGWDETNFWGRDREIRLMKIYHETETKKKWMLIFLTRRDRDETVLFIYVRDETESLGVFFYETETRTNF